MTKQAFYPMLGIYGPPGPDHMAEQARQAFGTEDAEEPSVVAARGTEYDPAVHWRTKEGELVLVVTLTDDHLRNCLRLLWRASEACLLREVMAWPDVNEGEGAETCAERMVSALPDDAIRMGPFAKKGSSLIDEWAMRGLARNAWASRQVAQAENVG